ncbi:ABC transporter ATP-binding protein [bacterium (Candidatus Blackallbacteria) CG17_big_fil_post_rev_8_21_14_2_50_48_46]|uniref:ABC transporter ATP-binding protein n=1 Tax=bacterium (Candidatus Blackallbacteria) CG17_big_fil_post_rev_8_21_14_2_50_48_46 TaxID=2014261 RepID=A0A2M7GBC6_9BACT|nr:MAG: ABC transporter ATP-binding protein [bacterium (Candidatus Blackallbacteria) CG18_big_fil_WC_8_21_14_2_50_49_26]PIW19485.1 MAG: ABC transporter ATP-binding protein [bacterium (Candidatus Blackallbacteria) CG17_big_fil_post_rev_8_21_14_2_50_48_46]PIW48911.1 MAG: ABC transporter ATP-binding protein [bacterium (Candidatus Blackallbacteria) CG13_big_fil_rev_8_21_14_2_50_49_14]
MIEVKNLHKSFGRKQVLRGIDFVFKDNQTTVVIGPSGCGKSTILRLILHLLSPDQGEIWVDGTNVSTLRRQDDLDRYRSKIGMVFQSAALFDSLKVWENVGFMFLENTRMPRDKVKAIAEEKLRLVGLEGSGDLYPAELSGGMQKRAGIARAMAQDPKIILYDEPTTGLDPVTSTVIEDLISDLQERTQGISIVVTHQLSTIFRTADLITMFYEGKILDTGTVDEMKNSENEIVRNFLEGKVVAP